LSLVYDRLFCTLEFNKVFEYTFGCKLEELANLYCNGECDESQQLLYEQYQKAYPAIDTDCIVNHICHNFENFEKTLKKNTVAEGENMLNLFVVNKKPDSDLLDKVSKSVESYKRFKRFATKTTNTNLVDTKKEKSHKAYETLNLMSVFYKNEIFDLTNGDLQLAFDCLVTISNNNEKLVWELMDETIIPIIKKAV